MSPVLRLKNSRNFFMTFVEYILKVGFLPEGKLFANLLLP